MFGGECDSRRAENVLWPEPGGVDQLLDGDIEEPRELLDRCGVWTEGLPVGDPLDRPLVDAGKAGHLRVAPAEATFAVDPIDRGLGRDQRHSC